MSDSLPPHEPQHTRPPCPSPTSKVYPNPCPLSRWCHPTISSSVIPFSSSPQSFPASGSFQMSQFFASGGQCIGVSASTSVLQWTPNTDLLYDGLSGSPCSPRDSQESSPTPQFKSISSSVLSFLFSPTLTSYMTTGKTIALTIWTFVSKVMSLLFNTLSRFVIAFLPRSKRLLISSRARIWSLVYLTPNPILGIKTLSLPEASLVAQRKEYACQFKPWVGKICWRRKCQPTPVFLAGKSHGQRILVHCNPWGHKESDTT